MVKNYHELPKFSDGLSYVYLEHCRIEQDEKSIACHDLQGVVKIPCASLGVIMLGPGTSITHEAIRSIADNGCLVLWVGEEGVRFYAQGMGETRSSRRLLLQTSLWCSKEKRLEVVRRMYELRFKGQVDIQNLSLEELRGLEGVRVRSAYARASKEFAVSWSGRDYTRSAWGETDAVNRALSAANACLYGICHAGIVSVGYSPALGFIHTSKQLSFVYDIADLYKTETTIPVAFGETSKGSLQLERRVRTTLRDVFREQRMLSRIVNDINKIMGVREEEAQEEPDFDIDAALPAPLWDGSKDSND